MIIPKIINYNDAWVEFKEKEQKLKISQIGIDYNIIINGKSVNRKQKIVYIKTKYNERTFDRKRNK